MNSGDYSADTEQLYNSYLTFVNYIIPIPGFIPDEEVSDWTKHIKIENTGDYECYVRVKVFAGSQYQEGLVYSDESGKWTPGDDGYYYYSDVIAPGAKSEELLVKISNMNLPKDFNVIVVSECTPVILDAEGNPGADWTKKADVAQTEEVGE